VSAPALQAVDGVARPLSLLAVAALAAGAVYVSWLRARALYGGDGPDPATLTNCPSCGARMAAAADDCEHCGAALDG
jgi:hypothetical protein